MILSIILSRSDEIVNPPEGVQIHIMIAMRFRP